MRGKSRGDEESWGETPFGIGLATRRSTLERGVSLTEREVRLCPVQTPRIGPEGINRPTTETEAIDRANFRAQQVRHRRRADESGFEPGGSGS